MARQGKSNEFVTKSTLKKAKLAAAKARQDLAGEFDTEADVKANTSDLDDVDVNPVQIPRKTNLALASSLAPPILTAQDIQARSLSPTATVVVHEESFAPPPIQKISLADP